MEKFITKYFGIVLGTIILTVIRIPAFFLLWVAMTFVLIISAFGISIESKNLDTIYDWYSRKKMS